MIKTNLNLMLMVLEEMREIDDTNSNANARNNTGLR